MSIYPGEMVWDLKPEGGGEPVQVVVSSAKEACNRDPARYSRTKPAAPAPEPEPASIPADDPPGGAV